jgi:hypothetical protein
MNGGSKRLKVETVKLSGLAKNWQSKGISQGNQKEGSPNTQHDPPPSNNVLSGLDDEDADSAKPLSNVLKGQDVMQKNEASLFLPFFHYNLREVIFVDHPHHRF